MGSNSFRVLGVPKVLRNDVECIILNELNSEDGVTIKTFPKGLPGIVFHHNDGRPAIEHITMHSGRKFSPPTLVLHGSGLESSVMYFGKGAYSVTQVILKPHALQSLLGIDAMMLKDRAVELNEFSSEDLNEQFLNACNDKQRVALLIQFLIAKLEQEKTRDFLVEESLRLIRQFVGRITVKALLDTLDISERQFERRFCHAVGISPLSYIRVRRFNEALRLMRCGQYDTLTDIAYALNFHDQSHFIRDIKTFTGITPKSLSQSVDDFTHNPGGYSYI